MGDDAGNDISLAVRPPGRVARRPWRGALQKRARRAPRNTLYRWSLGDVSKEEVISRLLRRVDQVCEQPLLVEPADPRAPGRYRGPSQVLMYRDEETGKMEIGIRAGEGGRVFAPVLELTVETGADLSVRHLEGRIRRAYPDGVIGLLGLGMASLAFGLIASLILAFTGMWTPSGVILLASLAVFGSTFGLSDVALRTVNTRGIHQRLVERVETAIEEERARGYR